VTISLLNGAAGNFTWLVDSSNSYELGARFTPGVNCTALALRWYAQDTTRPAGPTSLSLWDASTTARLATVVPSDNGGAGWQETILATPVALSAGREYRVSGFFPIGTRRAYWNSGASFVVPDGVTVPRSAIRCIATNATTTYPTTAVDGAVESTDVILDLTAPGSTPAATPSDLDNALADWLSEPDHTHGAGDGMPYDTWETGNDTNTKVTNGLNLAGGLQALSDNLANALQMASDYVAGRTSTYFADLKNRLIGASGGGGSAFYGPSGTQVAEGVETLLAQNVDATQLGAEMAKLREQLTLSPDLTDTSRWRLVDTVEGEGDALVELQADLYRITLGDAPGAHGPQLIAGVEWRPRWGWIAPRAHGCYLQRQPLVDVSPIGVAPGLFMDGLLLYSHPGFTWSVEAFVLDRP
jgi:hypothetical protein